MESVTELRALLGSSFTLQDLGTSHAFSSSLTGFLRPWGSMAPCSERGILYRVILVRPWESALELGPESL